MGQTIGGAEATDDTAGDRGLIERRLTQVLQRPIDVGEHRVLGQGISGAATYHVIVDGRAAVLKLTAASAAPYVRERARRELAFYREMAPYIPLRTPSVIATHMDSEGDALLLTAYQPAPPPDQWPASLYRDAARQLGRFHAAYWDRTSALDERTWLLRPRHEDVIAEIERAGEQWRALWERADERKVSLSISAVSPLGPGRAREGDLAAGSWDQWVASLLARMVEVNDVIASLPLTLCHGDCNPGNIVIAADGELVWADWQEARLARGPEDVSFLLQQASVYGGTVPHDAALEAYHHALTRATSKDIPLAVIRRVVDAAELWSRAIQWPAYLAAAPPGQVAAMLQRMRELVDRLAVAV